jgi:hypothetical protein
VTEEKRHVIPLEPDNRPDSQPGRRSGEGAGSVLPHLQQQVQSKAPPELGPPPPGVEPSDSQVVKPD